MMKHLLLIIILLATASTVTASNTEKCTSYSKLGEIFLTKRYKGMKATTLIKIFDSKTATKMILKSYDEPVYTSVQSQIKHIDRFTNSVFSECMNGEL